jgi:phage terminase large subunit-like protein
VATALVYPSTDEILAGLPADECERLYKAIRYRWPAWARPKQLPPAGDWDIWGIAGGRGVGKTRTGAEFTVDFAQQHPGGHFALVGRTARDTRDTMVLGESGVCSVAPPWFRPRYYPSRAVVVFPNGFQAHMYSAEEPDLLRGPQHHGGWGDEFAAWKKKEALSNLLDGLRLGEKPRLLFTTTPRRTPLFLDTFLGPRPDGGERPISAESIKGKDEWEFTTTTKDHFGQEIRFRTICRRGRSEENALFLSPGFAAKRRAAYGGSSYGRMEMDAEILELVEGALWVITTSVDPFRVETCPQHFRRIVVVDPSYAEDGDHDAAGIIVLGSGPSPDGKADPPHGYVMADRTVQGSPRAWGAAAVQAYDDFRADLIVYESTTPPGKPHVVPDVIKSVDPKGRVKWHPIHAGRDKRTRADPVASLYEAGRVHHLENPDKHDHLAHLEHEMASWDPWDPKAKSPNRLDALVHGLTYLLLGDTAPTVAPMSLGTRPSPWGSR